VLERAGGALAWDDGDGRPPLLRWRAAPPGVTVAFTSRLGGVSQGPFRSLNLGALTADAREHVAENRHRAVRGAGGDPALTAMSRQVHGKDVREVDERPAPGLFAEPGREDFPRCDGLVTSLPGRPLVVLAADCLPIALARADGGRVALLHAGWRGLVAGIVAAGAAAVGQEARAAVGPGAGPCCYAVGDDVAAAIRGRFGDDAVRDGRADLWRCAERALAEAGVEGADVARECTICDPDRFFSHRRDQGITGRQGAVALRG
jgi:polyphenol oxidase